MLPIVRADSDSDFDIDLDDDRRGGPWNSVLGVLRTVGGAIVFVAALVLVPGVPGAIEPPAGRRRARDCQPVPPLRDQGAGRRPGNWRAAN